MRSKSDFTRVFEQGRTFSNGMIVLKMAPNELSSNRFGIAVSKRIGNAVIRNKTKRRLKEIVRTLQIKQGWDVVLIARPQIKLAEFTQMQTSAKDIFSKAALLVPNTDN